MADTTTKPAKKAAEPKQPTLDQSYDTLLEAFEDEQHENHAEAVAYFEAAAKHVAADSPAVTKPRNVVEAIVAVMREVLWVGKDGRNNQQNYNFRGIDAAVNALGPAMRQHGLIVTPQVQTFEYGEIVVGQNRTKQAHVQVQVAYTFRHSNDSGVMTELTAVVPGESMDSGDKGTAKAMSVAFRICLLQQFALPTDMPDADHSTVTRGQAVVVPTSEEVRGACQWATEQADADHAFDYVFKRFGDGLGQMVVPTADGDSLPGDQYVEQTRQEHRAKVAEAARSAQDAAAHGDAPASQAPPAGDGQGQAADGEDLGAKVDRAIREVQAAWDKPDELRKIMEWTGKAGLHGAKIEGPDGLVGLADLINARGKELMSAQGGERERAQANGGERADAREPVQDQAEGERAAAQAQADSERAAAEKHAREETAPKPSKDEVRARQYEEELAFQAEVLGQPFESYSAQVRNSDESLSKVKTPRFLKDQKPTVVEKLRELGASTDAEVYESFGCPMSMDKMRQKVEEAAAAGDEAAAAAVDESTREPVNQ